ncbi:hypothetical protein T492DRAFT_845975 [Pavlovales sp. CCMP2436]|nr:hypothetical protein T492DRAFT_845975 [Pavlovales sp. CCMP2436]
MEDKAALAKFVTEEYIMIAEIWRSHISHFRRVALTFFPFLPYGSLLKRATLFEIAVLKYPLCNTDRSRLAQAVAQFCDGERPARVSLRIHGSAVPKASQNASPEPATQSHMWGPIHLPPPHIHPPIDGSVLLAFPPLIERFCPGGGDTMDPVGPSPLTIHVDLLKKLVGPWLAMSYKLKMDPDADSKLGWVLEMWGYSVSSTCLGVKHLVDPEFQFEGGSIGSHERMMEMFKIFHYTWYCIYFMPL